MSAAGTAALAVLWAAAAGCWYWLVRERRGRTRLLEEIARARAGAVRYRLSWITLMPEAHRTSFLLMVGAVPCRGLLEYRTAIPWTGPPRTVMAVDLPEPLLGPETSGYGAWDLAAGRGLFPGGVDVTAQYARFLSGLPRGVHPSLEWGERTIWLSLPGLLGAGDAFWTERGFSFLTEVVGRLLAERPR